jgi:hypothetical protein
MFMIQVKEDLVTKLRATLNECYIKTSLNVTNNLNRQGDFIIK